MTDQRPIDPSTLRDGDYVRAEGDGWAAEGYYYRREIRSKAGWNVVRLCGEPDERVTILRPVLVKGDRVEWVGASRKRKASTATVCQVNGDYVAVIRDDDVADKWPIEAVRRLPAAPEPAPVEVGSWWSDPEASSVFVVTAVEPDGRVPIRWLNHPDFTDDATHMNWFTKGHWTPLDGPPEPPVGSVYVIRGTVWESTNEGHWRVGMEGVDLWPEVQAYYDKVDLATLQIVHTLGVE